MRQTNKDPLAVNSTGYRHCPLCSYVCMSIQEIRDHLTEAHHVFASTKESKTESKS